MLKRCILISIICLVLIICTTSTAFTEEIADKPEPVDPIALLKTADEAIFIRSAFMQDFSENQGYVNELPTPNSIHQYYVFDGRGSDVLMSMLPSESIIRGGNKRLTFDQARKAEFHVTYSMILKESIPAQGGGCWIQFSNVALMGKGRESGVILFPGDHAYFFSPGEEIMVVEEIADLTALVPKKQIKFDFIRLEETTYFYANGKFLFSFNDQIKEAVSFESGSELSEGGNRIRCDFDNFTMRTK